MSGGLERREEGKPVFLKRLLEDLTLVAGGEGRAGWGAP